jgi:hypothetical protein
MKKIRNLATLDNEILRRRLELKNLEVRLEKNLDYFQENYGSLFMNSFHAFRKKSEHQKNGRGFFEYIFNSDGFRSAFSGFGEHMAERLTEKVEKIMERFFHRK